MSWKVKIIKPIPNKWDKALMVVVMVVMVHWILKFLLACIANWNPVQWVCLFVMSLSVIHEPNGPTRHSHFEHSSIPATVKKLFNLNSNFLTKRDAWAGTFENYFLRDSPRDDCPGSIISLICSMHLVHCHKITDNNNIILPSLPCPVL